MHIFLSWSGPTSKAIATALKEWLPLVIQATEPFLSSHDIAAGDRWEREIAEHLERSAFGILCLTPDNLTAPWILYEAGALSKQVTTSRVIPLLWRVTAEEVRRPLGQFQAMRLSERSEVRAMIGSINAQLPGGGMTETRVDNIFEALWPQLQAELQRIQESIQPQDPRPPENPLETLRAMTAELLELARSQHRMQSETGLSPESAGRRILIGEAVREYATTVESALTSVSASLARGVIGMNLSADERDRIYHEAGLACERAGDRVGRSHHKLYHRLREISGIDIITPT